MGILWGNMWQVRAVMGSQLPGGLRHPQTPWGSCLGPTGLSDMALGGGLIPPIPGRGVLSLATPKQHFEKSPRFAQASLDVPGALPYP